MKIERLKKEIIKLSEGKEFIHNEWFIKFHLEIVERIVEDLIESYPEADEDICRILVWVHDYPKIIDYDNEHANDNIQKVKDFLISLDFDKEIAETVLKYLTIFERKMDMDLKEAPLEVQIVSSADAASHLVGPFISIYWKEFNHKSIHELMSDNIKKLEKDWDRKITLPEVKVKYKTLHNFHKSLYDINNY